MLSRVKIVSPLSGHLWPLERVPDPVFAQRIPRRTVERFISTINLQHGNKTADARSVTAIMSLEATHGAKVQVLASGVDANTAVEQLAELLAQGCGDEGYVPASAPATTTIAPTATPASDRDSFDPNQILGGAPSSGLALGEDFQVRRSEIPVVDDCSRMVPSVANLRSKLMP